MDKGVEGKTEGQVWVGGRAKGGETAVGKEESGSHGGGSQRLALETRLREHRRSGRAFRDAVP